MQRFHACNSALSLSTGLDMNEDVADSGNLAANIVFHFMRNVMGLLNGHLWVYFDVYVGVEMIVYFPHEALFDLFNVFD